MAGVFDKELQCVENLRREGNRYVVTEKDLLSRVKTKVPELVAMPFFC
jgi:hypothetical protein